MPEYVSVGGKWEARNIYHVNANAKRGENPVYEGPDPEAKRELEAGNINSTPGNTHPDMIVRARELGFKTVDEFLKTTMGVDYQENLKKQEAKLKEFDVTSERDKKPKKKPVRVPSGGDDYSGSGKSVEGGFGDHEKVLK